MITSVSRFAASRMARSVLIVCLGNICRSPMGEAVLAHVAKQRGIDIAVDSAGTAGYHIGEEPDERTVAICKKHNIRISHEARQVKPEDFKTFTYILASDSMNLASLERIKPTDSTAVVKLWGAYDDGKPIEDPYYGGVRGFERTYQQCLKYSNAFLNQIEGEQTQTLLEASL